MFPKIWCVCLFEASLCLKIMLCCSYPIGPYGPGPWRGHGQYKLGAWCPFAPARGNHVKEDPDIMPWALVEKGGGGTIPYYLIWSWNSVIVVYNILRNISCIIIYYHICCYIILYCSIFSKLFGVLSYVDFEASNFRKWLPLEGATDTKRQAIVPGHTAL